MDCRLETPKQLATRVGLSLGAIYRLINDGRLPFVRIGTRLRIPPGTWEEFIANNTVKPCRDAIRDPSLNFSPNAGVITSFGRSEAAAASAALARQTAQRLKSGSRSSCNATPENAVHVIPPKFS
ncbi:MAG: helix-turn-helix domain-containing protein [Hyphomicrobiales bacterium]|nr:helix-turn-helix domain-containing protein [Hyphomicrobiales bacterium]